MANQEKKTSKLEPKRWSALYLWAPLIVLLVSIIFYLSLSEIHKVTLKEKDSTKSNGAANSDQDNSSSPPNSLLDKTFISFLNSKDVLNNFNRHMLQPRIKSLLNIDYFRYVKVNLKRPCKLWCNNDKCNMRDCQVKLPSDPYKCPVPDYEAELSTVNTDLPSDQLDLLIKLFECYDTDDPDTQYVDLLINPERFTGYSGETAHRVWRAIYEENCFIRKTRSPFNSELCYEERLFYEAISGLHSSINIHLCAEYPSNSLINSFEPHLDEFLRRFKDHNDYLENLYTLYLLELKALSKSKHYLLNKVNWPESSTKDFVEEILKVVNKLEISKFEDLSLKPSHVSHELAVHFRNITTTIIDCVACDKCKLWGKVQLRGIGAAFKILSIKDNDKLSLNHQEIVSLINAIARLSNSISQLERFRSLLLPMYNVK